MGPSARQIINYDTGIVLIDLHQLNVKTASDNANQRHTEYGATSCQRRTEPEQQPAARFPNQMIEQINIALEQKGPGISQPGSLKPAVELTSKKKAYTSIKSDEE